VDINDKSGLDDSEPPPASDLTPRHGLDDADAIRRELGKGKKRWITVAGVLIVAAFGLLVAQFLQDATVFFRNVDQAVAERDELGDRRFRIQGRVIPDSVEVIGDVVTFEILHGCATAGVRHLTDPAELFDNPWIPVVLDGSWKPQTVQLVGGTDDPRLVPLLAGILELLPWITQWHGEIDPQFGVRMDDYFRGLVEEEARKMGLTSEELRAWQPPARARQRRKRQR